jgi:MFS family permease
MPASQSAALETAIAGEQTGMKSVRGYREAFSSAAVIQLAAMYFFWAIGLFGFVLWLPTFIRQSGVSEMVMLGWLSAGPYLAVSLVMVAASVASDRARNRVHFVWPLLLVAAISFLLLYFLWPAPFWIGYALLVIVGIGVLVPIPIFFCMPAEILPKNVAGGAIALINSLGALGGFLGTYLVGLATGLTGNSASSFLLMGAALLISTALWLPRSWRR